MKKVHLYTHLLPLLFILTFINSCSAQTSPMASEGKKPASIVETLKANDHLPIEGKIALYHQLKKDSPDAYNFKNEDELNLYGYTLLWNNKVTEALEIFKLLVSEFPNSANAYDSLGEAYLKHGNKEQAFVNYEKSLALDPENFNADDQMQAIRYPNKVPEKLGDKFEKVYTAQAYRDDLNQLGKALTKVHPNVFKFISRENFWKIIEAKQALMTDHTTYGEFSWHCSEIIASINCAHTSMGSFDQETELLPVSLRFPLQVRWVNDHLFVIDPLNNGDRVKIKDEILTINKVPVADLIRDIYKHIPSQGYIETTKKHFFNTWATGMIPFALDFPENYEIVLKGIENPITLNKAKTTNDPLPDPSIKRCENNLCLEFLDNNKTALMTIRSFVYYPWNDFNVFQDFIDKSMKDIHEKGVKNLIIDVRFNGGGSQYASIHLLKYLVDKPFTYYSTAQFDGKVEKIMGEDVEAPFKETFKGKLYFIIDGIGNSTTGHFMSLVKVLKLGTIVGEELGSNQFCSAGQKICRLTNTKLVYYVANNTHVTTATSLPDETGILPDHYVTQSIDDYLNHVDAVKEFTLKLISEKW